MANDDAFTVNFTTSGFIDVDVDPTNAVTPDCFGAWTVPAVDWDTLDDTNRLFYQMRTHDAINNNKKISTSPSNDLFTPPPPYTVINATGTP